MITWRAKLSAKLLRYAISRQQSENTKGGERLINTYGKRVAEILCQENLEVNSKKGTLGIVGIGDLAGNAVWMTLVPTWYLPLSRSRRIQLVLKGHSVELQRFLTRVRGDPWPSVNAKCHVNVTREKIDVWWVNDHKTNTEVRLRPIVRKDVGV